MKKTFQSKSQRSNKALKNPNHKTINSRMKFNSENKPIISRNKTLKNSIGNSFIKDKSKPKIQNQTSKNIQSKPNNLLLSNQYIKMKNKPTVQLKKLIKTPSSKKEIKLINDKKTSKKIMNTNLKDYNHNKLIRGNSSYAGTAVSTANGNNVTDNGINTKRNENILKHLIENINIKEIEKISNVELLQNNIFLIKIYSFIYNMTSSNYVVSNLINNIEIIQQFKELTNKIDFLNNNKPINYNLINGNLFYSNENHISFESNNRKLIYKNFFDFFEQMLNDIVQLTNKLHKIQNESVIKKNEEIISVNSKVDFNSNLIEKSDSHLFSNYSIKDNIIRGENNKYYGMDDSNGISSVDNDFYQMLLKNSFKDKNNKNNNQETSKINSRNKQINQNSQSSSSSSSTIINNDSSDSDIIVNYSISEHNPINNNKNNNKLEIRKQINIPILNTNKLEIKKNDIISVSPKKKENNNNLEKENIKPLKVINKPIIKENINPEKKDDLCNIF